MKEPGISFLVRARNEEERLVKCLESLQNIKVPHEIILVLHLCKDRSLEIANDFARKNPNLKIFLQDLEISRAGYQTLMTPERNVHSLVTFNNWTASKSKYIWTFKQDADFCANDKLIEFLNGLDISCTEPTAYRIRCMLDDHANNELYLSNCIEKYSKYQFWEVPVMPQKRILECPPDCIIQSISRSIVKSYWQEEPWYKQNEYFLKQYQFIESLLGPEPLAMASASNPACTEKFHKVVQNRDVLFQHCIQATPLHLDFVEIGTSDFDTCIQSCDASALGMSIDPLQEYLDRLPEKKNVIKVNSAISNCDGSIDCQYVSSDDIQKQNLPWGFRGCNSVGAPHPTVANWLRSKKIDLSIIQCTPVKKISFETLIQDYDIASIKYLKTDTEGHDCTILSSYMNAIRKNLIPKVPKIRFESNVLTKSEILAQTISQLQDMGQKVISSGEDTVMELL